MNNTSETESYASSASVPPSSAHGGPPSRIRRGRVLRDTAVGDGLVFVDGDTYPFRLEQLWRSEIAPRVNMAVNVEFGLDARITSIRAVPGSQLLNDHTAQALDAAHKAAKEIASEFNQKGAPALQWVVRRVGMTRLAAVCALALGWYSMHVLVIDLGGLGKLSLSFYDVLKVLNSDILGGDFRALLMAESSNPLAAQAAGLYGFAALVAVVAPLVTPFLKDRRLWLADVAPLLVLGIVAAVACFQVTSVIDAAQSALGALGISSTAESRDLRQQVTQTLARSVSIGLGAYVSTLSGLYFAVSGYMRFRRAAPPVAS